MPHFRSTARSAAIIATAIGWGAVVSCDATVFANEAVTATAQALPGYACAQVAITAETAPAFTVPVPPHAADAMPDVLAAPSASAPRIGKVGALVAVRSPGNPTAGYVQTLLLNGRPGWVRADVLQPYHALSAPRARCAVVRRPGGVGFMTWTPNR